MSTMEQGLISADSHVVEPPDLWSARLPPRQRDRAPKLVRQADGGDAWLVEGRDPVSLAPISPSGSEHRDLRRRGDEPVTFDAVLRGAWDPHARLELQDRASLDAEVLYPLPQLWDQIKGIADDELRLACYLAYNDWIAEVSAVAPTRLIGLGKIPNTSLADAVAELGRCGGELGLRGVVLDAWPAGKAPSEEDDDFWALVEELRLPVSIHRALGARPTGQSRVLIPSRENLLPALTLAEGGVLDRHPGVQVVVAHAGCGWAPAALEAADVRYLRLRGTGTPSLPRDDVVPSHYIQRHTWYTFQDDRVGVLNREVLGTAHLLWASHVPLDGSDHPDERQQAELVTQSVPGPDKARLLAGNCARLYRLPGNEDGFTTDEITASTGSLLLL
jgi:predicted TIM-barrel fold metal-dependent hydrolase